jgi:ribosomal protein S18 acetylase RimI-like enzyme
MEAETLTTPAGMLTIAPATAAEADIVIDVLDEAARWLVSRGIDQWRPGMFERSLVLEAIKSGEMYLVRRAGEVVGTVSLSWDDTLTWGATADDAGYAHDLAIRRTVGGHGVGRALLDWAGRRAAANGKAFLRLDCDAGNAALNDYYRRAGFTYRGTVVSPYGGRRVNLYERPAS